MSLTVPVDAPARSRVLTGDRPTGPLHLGHLFGTLLNRVRLQEAGADLIVLVADYQTITDRDSPATLAGDVDALVADYLAVGIDPERATIFAHSQVPALNQLLLPFLSLVTVPELMRNPTVKEEAAVAGSETLGALMLTYPVHQAADILACRASVVPVGADQLPHLEMARAIARRFNRRYGEVFPEPEALVGEAPALLGVDGRKMSKSRGNAIAISTTADETARLIRRAQTDAEPAITYAPDNRPEVSNLVLLCALCEGIDPDQVAEEIGARGSAELKRRATEAVNERLRPIRARHLELCRDPGYLRRVLRDGNERVNELANETLGLVSAAMHTRY
jgi:tryptophanyl-tRNA synthetase